MLILVVELDLVVYLFILVLVFMMIFDCVRFTRFVFVSVVELILTCNIGFELMLIQFTYLAVYKRNFPKSNEIFFLFGNLPQNQICSGWKMLILLLFPIILTALLLPS